MQIAKLLNLDAETVSARALVYHAYALDQWQQSRKAAKQPHGPALADPAPVDFLTIAASYLAVVDIQQAAECFKTAAHAALDFALKQTGSHREGQRQSFHASDAFISDEWFARAATLNICAGNDTELDIPECNFEKQGLLLPPSRVAAELLLASAAHLRKRGNQRSSGYLRHLKDWAEKNAGHGIGQMRIPLTFYSRLADVILKQSMAPDLEPWLQDLGAHIDRQVKIAQATPTHWASMHTALLPIEPEPLSLIAIYLKLPYSREIVFGSHPDALLAYLEVAKALKTPRQ